MELLLQVINYICGGFNMAFIESVVEELEKSGWNSNRKIDTEEINVTLNDEGYEISNNCIKFFEQFGMLEFEHPAFRVKDRNKSIHFNPLKACENIYRERVETYESRAGETLVVIGEAYDGNLTLMLSKSGKVYGSYDNFLTLLGDTIEVALENIFIGVETEEIPM